MEEEKEGNSNFFNTLDHSILKQPINTGIQNIQQILSCVQNGSPEVQDIIMNECHILYECKVCRNLFRGLPNLIAHKRFYCKESYCKVHKRPNNMQQESTLIVQPEDAPEIDIEEQGEQSPADNQESDKDVEIQEIRFDPPPIYHSPNKDSIFQRRASSSDDLDVGNDFSDVELTDDEDTDPKSIIELQKIRGNPNAVHMSVALPENLETNSPSEEEDTTLPNIKQEEEEPDTERQESSKEEFSDLTHQKQLMKMSSCCVKTLRCLKCKTSYTTLKTLYTHMKSIHATKRLFYPCPICKTAFMKMWGVQRHLSTVHHRSKEQINKLKEITKRHIFTKRVISSTAGQKRFISLNDKAKGHNADVTQNDEYTCRKCGRSFDRRSSIVNHEKFCSSRIKNDNGQATRKNEDNNLVKKEQQGPSMHKCFKCNRMFARKPSQLTHTKFCKGKITTESHGTYKCCHCGRLFERKSAQLTHTKFCKRRPQQIHSAVPRPVVKTPLPLEPAVKIKVEPKTEETSNLNVLTRSRRVVTKKTHTDFVSSQTLKWRSANKVESVEADKGQQSGSHVDKDTYFRKLDPNFKIQKLKDLNHIERKVLSIINVEKLVCLKCRKKFSSFSNAKRHAATYHIGWMRFKCKHCPYKSYNRSDCRYHIDKVHYGSNEPPDTDNQKGLVKAIKKEILEDVDEDSNVEKSSPKKTLSKSPVPCVSVKKLQLPRWADSIKVISHKSLDQITTSTRDTFGKMKSQQMSYQPNPVKKQKPSILQSSKQEFERAPVHKTPVPAKNPVQNLTDSTKSSESEKENKDLVKCSQKDAENSVTVTTESKTETLHDLEAGKGKATETNANATESQDLQKADKPESQDLQKADKPESQDLQKADKPESQDLQKADKPESQDLQKADKPESQDLQKAGKPESQDLQKAGKPASQTFERFEEHDNLSPDSEDLQSLLESANELFERENSNEEKSQNVATATRITSPSMAEVKKPSWRNTTTSPFITKLVRTTPLIPVAEKKCIEITRAQATETSVKTMLPTGTIELHRGEETGTVIENLTNVGKEHLVPPNTNIQLTETEAANVCIPSFSDLPQKVVYASPPAQNAIPKRFVVKASPQKCIVKPPKKCGLTLPQLPVVVEESQNVTAGDHAYMATTQQPTVVLLNASGSQIGRTFTVSVMNPETYRSENTPKKCITILKKSVDSGLVLARESMEPSAAETEAAIQSVVEQQPMDQM